MLCIILELRVFNPHSHIPTPQDGIAQFREFAEWVEREAIASMKEDISYGEIPEEFKGQETISPMI